MTVVLHYLMTPMRFCAQIQSPSQSVSFRPSLRTKKIWLKASWHLHDSHIDIAINVDMTHFMSMWISMWILCYVNI